VLLAAGWFPEIRSLRVLAAVVFSLYSLSETSVTGSHRDYANMYSCWALALLPLSSIVAVRGVALAVCVFLIAGSGWSKVLVGGGFRAWADGDTLGTIIAHYQQFSFADAGPGVPAVAALCASPSMRPLVGVLATLTLVFEIAIVPASLLCMPSAWRFTMVWASLAMHVGIAAMQSFIIGMAFVPNMATYALGFGGFLGFEGEGAAGLEPWVGDGWWVAVGVVAGLAAITLVRTLMLRIEEEGRSPADDPNAVTVRLLPEDWPCTPFALFAWNGAQWKDLFQRFHTGDTRLVLLTASAAQRLGRDGKQKQEKKKKEKSAGAPDASGAMALVGHTVLAHMASRSRDKVDAAADVRLHDFWELGLGETFAHGPVLEKYRWGDAWDARRFCADVEAWLVEEKRLVDLVSGEFLEVAAFVEVAKEKGGGGGVVTRVLAAGTLGKSF
jgi:hypothetical protein